MKYVFTIFLFVNVNCFGTTNAEDTVYAIAPEQNIFKFVKDKIEKSKESLKLNVFILDYKPLADLLIETKEKGIEVEVIVDFRSVTLPLRDSDQTYYMSSVEYLMEHSVDIKVYKGHANQINHHKYLLIDGKKLLIGSYNFQKEAQEINHENFIQITDPQIVEAFNNNFNSLSTNNRTFKYQNLSSVKVAFIKAYGFHVVKQVAKFFLKYLLVPIILLASYLFYKKKLCLIIKK